MPCVTRRVKSDTAVFFPQYMVRPDRIKYERIHQIIIAQKVRNSNTEATVAMKALHESGMPTPHSTVKNARILHLHLPHSNTTFLPASANRFFERSRSSATTERIEESSRCKENQPPYAPVQRGLIMMSIVRLRVILRRSQKVTIQEERSVRSKGTVSGKSDHTFCYGGQALCLALFSDVRSAHDDESCFGKTL
mmetsp:Transcript_4127/g.9171  ORF Transcript_4127/g.9171 Transcript_4127/m.9171 type:complete len:194 (-) Transcript_4127:502-1083(-)